MKVSFTKGLHKLDRMEIERADGSRESIDCPKQRIIPHDMVHFGVESVLRKRGFMTRVKDGEAASYRMGAEPEADAVERLVEIMQGDAWSGGTTYAHAMLDLYRVTCDARACPCLPVTVDDIETLRRTLVALDVQWQAVPVGGTLRLEM